MDEWRSRVMVSNGGLPRSTVPPENMDSVKEREDTEEGENINMVHRKGTGPLSMEATWDETTPQGFSMTRLYAAGKVSMGREGSGLKFCCKNSRRKKSSTLAKQTAFSAATNPAGLLHGVHLSATACSIWQGGWTDGRRGEVRGRTAAAGPPPRPPGRCPG